MQYCGKEKNEKQEREFNAWLDELEEAAAYRDLIAAYGDAH
jgi:hypothetical protein